MIEPTAIQASIPALLEQLDSADSPAALYEVMRRLEWLNCALLAVAEEHVSEDEHQFLVPYLILDGDNTPLAIMVISRQAKIFADDPRLDGSVATTYMDQHLVGQEPFLVSDGVPYFRLPY